MTQEQRAEIQAFRTAYQGTGRWLDSADLDSELRAAQMQLIDARNAWDAERPTWRDDWEGEMIAKEDPWFAEANALWRADQERLIYLADRRN